MRCGAEAIRCESNRLHPPPSCQTFPGAGGNDAPTHQRWAHVTAARYALCPFFTRRAAAHERASDQGARRIAVSDDLTLATNTPSPRPRSPKLARGGRSWLATLLLLLLI